MNSLTKKLAAGVIAAATMFSIAGLGATTANAANASDGSIEVSSSNAEFKGKTVTAYQMFTYDKEAVENGTATNSGYALISSWDDFFLHIVQVEGATAENVSQKAYDYVASLKDANVVNFAKKASDWVKSQENFGASLKHEAIAAANGNTYTATINNLSYGYYVVSPAAGSTDTTTKRGTDAMLLNVKNSTPVKQNLKSTYPTIQKTVQNGNEDSTHNSAQIGDTVNFKLASTVPDMAEYTNYTFKFTDTLSKGLTLNNTAATGNTFTAVVKIDGTVVDTGDYTAMFTKDTISGTTSLEVNMTDFKTKHQHDAGKTITVEYSATLNTDAAVAGNGNDNTAKIIYSNDPSSNSTGGTGEDKTYTYTFNFAINKVDKPNANPDKIKEELAAMNFLVEEWGGKYQSQDISAKKGTGVQELLEKVLLEAEMLDLKANPNRKATGSIIESSLDKGRGYVATVLVSNGTLHVGDIVLAGTSYGKVKAMFNERNQRLKEAGPAEPVLILGLNGAPAAGDTFHVFDTDQEAREIANKREQLQREQGLRTQKMLTLDEVGRRLALGDFHELNVIVKGDVDGSVEALSDSLIKLSTEQIQVNVIHKGVGQISESDVSLAAASDAIIVGFQVRPSSNAAKLAEQEGVDIRKYSIIYDAIEEVKSAMEGMLAPTLKEQVTATIEVREVFNISKVGMVAGAMVKTGKVKRSDKARLIRDGIVVFTGSINALKRFKDDVKEVATNFECGISLTNCNDLKVGDVIETYEEIEVKQTL